MDHRLKAQIDRLRKISLYLFLFTQIAIFGTLFIHNILTTSKYNYNYNPLSNQNLENIDCNENNNFCYNYSWKTQSKKLDECSINVIKDLFNIEELGFTEKNQVKFAALGPRFLEVQEKSHKQINEKLKFGVIDSIHGSCMFINKEIFLKIGKFDENFFLYFEETEYCYRAKKKGYFSYQINDIKVRTKGRTVNLENERNKNFSNILIWHFIWSRFYFSKKKYGKLLSIIIFTPLLLRILLRIRWYKITKNEILLSKYAARFEGLLKSMKGEKSNLRP